MSKAYHVKQVRRIKNDRRKRSVVKSQPNVKSKVRQGTSKPIKSKQAVTKHKVEKMAVKPNVKVKGNKGVKRDFSSLDFLDLDLLHSKHPRVNVSSDDAVVLSKVTKEYLEGEHKIIGVSDIDLRVKKGEFVYITGDSGAGKSTLLKLINRELRATHGTVVTLGKPVTHLSDHDLACLRRRLGVVFQDYRLLLNHNVADNIAYPLELLLYDPDVIKHRVHEMLHFIGLSKRVNSKVSDLSGGQQQRVAIARALASDPELILADELTGNLDWDNTLMVMRLLEKINHEGKTIIMSTHSRDVLKAFPHRQLSLYNGHVKTLEPA